eukprot:3241389-Prymnesium_polylepis.1
MAKAGVGIDPPVELGRGLVRIKSSAPCISNIAGGVADPNFRARFGFLLTFLTYVWVPQVGSCARMAQ